MSTLRPLTYSDLSAMLRHHFQAAAPRPHCSYASSTVWPPHSAGCMTGRISAEPSPSKDLPLHLYLTPPPSPCLPCGLWCIPYPFTAAWWSGVHFCRSARLILAPLSSRKRTTATWPRARGHGEHWGHRGRLHPSKGNRTLSAATKPSNPLQTPLWGPSLTARTIPTIGCRQVQRCSIQLVRHVNVGPVGLEQGHHLLSGHVTIRESISAIPTGHPHIGPTAPNTLPDTRDAIWTARERAVITILDVSRAHLLSRARP